MKKTISTQDFHDAFKNAGRESHFSSDGLDALFEHLEEYERDCGTEIELDVIALCCDYTEDRLVAVLKDNEMDSLDELENLTLVIIVDDDIIIYLNF